MAPIKNPTYPWGLRSVYNLPPPLLFYHNHHYHFQYAHIASATITARRACRKAHQPTRLDERPRDERPLPAKRRSGVSRQPPRQQHERQNQPRRQKGIANTTTMQCNAMQCNAMQCNANANANAMQMQRNAVSNKKSRETEQDGTIGRLAPARRRRLGGGEGHQIRRVVALAREPPVRDPRV